jgi:osmotically-inducible protein OsmY
MVIRRIREHVATHNWFAVLVDVVIVVLGVFLGTQVNNWNQARLDAGRAEEYRTRLVDELDFNARQYALQTAYYRRARAYGLRALASLDGGRPLSDRDFVIAAYQLTQTDTTMAKTGVYAEMTTNGLGDRLGDAETQQVASDFYLTAQVSQQLLESTFPYRTMLREAMPYAVQARIREECGDRSVYYKGRLVGITTVSPCPMRMSRQEASQAAAAVRSVPEIEGQMTRYIASLDEKIANLELAAQQASAFRARLIAAAQRSSA